MPSKESVDVHLNSSQNSGSKHHSCGQSREQEWTQITAAEVSFELSSIKSRHSIVTWVTLGFWQLKISGL